MKLLVISSYPEHNQTHSKKTVGVASYSKTLLTALKKTHPELSINVIAERFNDLPHHSGKRQRVQNREEADAGQSQPRGDLRHDDNYIEQGIQVKRLWKRASFVGLLRMFFTALGSKRTKLLVPFEAHMFGKPQHTVFALLLFCLLRLSGKQTYFLVHQVLADFRELEPNPYKAWLLNRTKALLYLLLRLAATQTIVFEQQLKEQLGSKHTYVIPHIIPNVTRIPKQQAREKLGWDKKKPYALCFGFLAPYKGILELIHDWPDNQDIQLVIAGGKNPNHITNKRIDAYVDTVMALTKKKHIRTTGFVPENMLPYYFSAADVIILPYKTFFSSSGPLSLALAYKTPVLLSQTLSAYEKTPDVQTALQEAALSMQDITIQPGSGTLVQTQQMLHTKKAQLEAFAREMQQARTAERIAEQYYKTIWGTSITN